MMPKNRIGKLPEGNDPLAVADERCMSVAVYERGFDARSEHLSIRLLAGVKTVKYDGPDGKPAFVTGDYPTIARTLEANGYGPVIWKTEGVVHLSSPFPTEEPS